LVPNTELVVVVYGSERCELNASGFVACLREMFTGQALRAFP